MGSLGNAGTAGKVSRFGRRRKKSRPALFCPQRARLQNALVWKTRLLAESNATWRDKSHTRGEWGQPFSELSPTR